MAERLITVEVAYADTGRQLVRRVELIEGSTVTEAIAAAGIAGMFIDGMVDTRYLGIFGRKVTRDQIVRDGDRVEIYRPLERNPMEARRQRAR